MNKEKLNDFLSTQQSYVDFGLDFQPKEVQKLLDIIYDLIDGVERIESVLYTDDSEDKTSAILKLTYNTINKGLE